MAVNPKSPGVYIDEIPVFPASIVGVATAVPAFIGYVEKAENNGIGIPYNTPVRITSLLEYEAIFGKADPQSFSTIQIDDNTNVTPTVRTVTVTKGTESLFKLYYNMQMYFSNGGGPCYVVPIGLYSTVSTVSKTDMLTGLTAIAKVDEPTLLLFPDAVSLTNPAHRAEVYDTALAQCQKLKDRFTIMDVVHKSGDTVFTDVSNFRSLGVGPDNLKYGAAYYPFLNTTLGFGLNESLLHVTAQKENGNPVSDSVDVIDFLNKMELAVLKAQQGFSNAKIEIVTLSNNNIQAFLTAVSSAVSAASTAVGLATGFSTLVTPFANAATDVTTGYFFTDNDNYINTPGPNQATALALVAGYNQLIANLNSLRNQAYVILNGISGYALGSLANMKNANPSLYNTIIAQITSYSVQLNPSGAVAGIYARVDAQRGVWKAPANVGVTSIVGPSINVTNSEQDDMNIDPTGGKSVNAIRTFVGRGTLVWGARTLAGNDNEWRYINVRRLFTFVEESTSEATEFVVFEPNTANTWQKVKGMIEAFLTGLWRDGALAGATTKDAFFVNVGLGTTMTAQDILEGRMIVQIGMAAVRPAEFIILQFEHKLQES
jgi:phage tail sheath protein FI